MKRRLRLSLLGMTMALAMLTGIAQAADYYVVVGAFSSEINARRFTTQMSTHFREVTYTFNAERNLYYVYVLKTSKKAAADKKSQYLRTFRNFKDVWVLTDNTEALARKNDIAPTVEERNTHVSTASHSPRYEGGLFSGTSGPVMASAATPGTYLQYETSRVETPAEQINWTTTSGLSFASGVDTPNLYMGGHAAENIFKFVVEDSDGEEIDAEVMLVDFENVKRIAGFRTGENVAIRGTKREQMVTLVCDVLGYGQETRMYNIDHLSRGRDIKKNKDGIWEVRFQLTKMEVHEIAFLNKTAFYSDAAVLKPSSREELQELVALMTANPSYKIIVHSHCNPGERREIRLPEEGDYFDLESAARMTGSDKKLTKARANIVREFLITAGIDKKRIGVVGWGGLEPIARVSGPDADLNERIEIELAQD